MANSNSNTNTNSNSNSAIGHSAPEGRRRTRRARPGWRRSRRLYMTGVEKTLYYMFVLRSYRYFARAPQGSRKVPAREAASNPNEHLVTEYLAPVICITIYIYIYTHTFIHTYIHAYTFMYMYCTHLLQELVLQTL